MNMLSKSGRVRIARFVRSLRRTARLAERNLIHFWTGQYNYPRRTVAIVWYMSATGVVTAGLMLYAFVSILL